VCRASDGRRYQGASFAKLSARSKYPRQCRSVERANRHAARPGRGSYHTVTRPHRLILCHSDATKPGPQTSGFNTHAAAPCPAAPARPRPHPTTPAAQPEPWRACLLRHRATLPTRRTSACEHMPPAGLARSDQTHIPPPDLTIPCTETRMGSPSLGLLGPLGLLRAPGSEQPTRKLRCSKMFSSRCQERRQLNGPRANG
jgi:hypothetical protein